MSACVIVTVTGFEKADVILRKKAAEVADSAAPETETGIVGMTMTMIPAR